MRHRGRGKAQIFIWLAVFAFAAIVVASYRPAPESVQLAAKRATNGTFSISGNVDGLFPGIPQTLDISINNPNDFEIHVTDLQTTVSSAPGCDASNLTVGSYTGTLDVAGDDVSSVSVPIVLSPAADDGCQNASLPLRFTAKATADRQPRGDDGGNGGGGNNNGGNKGGSNGGNNDGSGNDPSSDAPGTHRGNTSVLGVTITRPGTLPKTGVPIAKLVLTGVMLIAIGRLLLVSTRVNIRNRPTRAHDRSLRASPRDF